mgnify:CR=1 FL=1
MTDAEKKAFDQGYVIACCNIVNLHNDDCVAADVFIEGSATMKDALSWGLTEYDLRALKQMREARPRNFDNR